MGIQVQGIPKICHSTHYLGKKGRAHKTKICRVTHWQQKKHFICNTQWRQCTMRQCVT